MTSMQYVEATIGECERLALCEQLIPEGARLRSG
jgi:hypothetical protein